MTLKYREIEIHLHYCNGIEFTHSHTTVKEATEEYARLLAEAIEPSGDLAEALHLEQVVMILAGDSAEPIRTVDSGVFTCPHQDPVPA